MGTIHAASNEPARPSKILSSASILSNILVTAQCQLSRFLQVCKVAGSGPSGSDLIGCEEGDGSVNLGSVHGWIAGGCRSGNHVTTRDITAFHRIIHSAAHCCWDYCGGRGLYRQGDNLSNYLTIEIRLPEASKYNLWHLLQQYCL